MTVFQKNSPSLVTKINFYMICWSSLFSLNRPFFYTKFFKSHFHLLVKKLKKNELKIILEAFKTVMHKVCSVWPFVWTTVLPTVCSIRSMAWTTVWSGVWSILSIVWTNTVKSDRRWSKSVWSDLRWSKSVQSGQYLFLEPHCPRPKLVWPKPVLGPGPHPGK